MEDETWLDEEFSIGKKVKINLRDMNTIGWKEDLEEDLKTALHILEDMKKVTAQNDKKLSVLKEQIKNKIENPINQNNKKIIIFTAFADTANYLYEELKDFNLSLQLQTAKITGSDINKSTLNINNEFNNLLCYF